MDWRMKLSFGSPLVLLVEVAVAVAALLQCAAATTTHEVGDSLGWTLTPDGSITYSIWASSQSFIVGDILVFNFTTGEHDVAEVSKASFDACDETSTIGSIIDTGPARIILSSIGDHYFMCTVIGHCSFGQKLAITVTDGSTTASPPADSPPLIISPVIAMTPKVSIAPTLPNPSATSPPSISPPPATTPTPTPSIAPRPANPPAVTTSPPFLTLSPILAPTPSEASGPANPLPSIASTPSISPSPMLAPGPATPLAGMTSPPSVNLSPILAPTPGPANPLGIIDSPPPISPSPMSASIPSKAPGPATPLVGMASPPYMNLSTSLAPTPGPANPPEIIASPPFIILSPSLAPTLSSAPGPANPPTRIGSPPSVSPAPSSMLAPTIARVPVTNVVGDSLRWTIPLGGPITYETWANGKTFMVGDTLYFDFPTGEHDVAEVPKQGFDACDTNSTIGPIHYIGPVTITLNSPGQHFFICSFSAHCSFGQKLAINVSAVPTFAPSPSPTLPTSVASPSSSTWHGSSPSSTASPPSTTTSRTLAPTHSRPLETHTVGGSSGWVLPPGGPSVYANWASRKTFVVGDNLLFNFATGQHDVAEVTKSSFEACNKAIIIGSPIETGPVNITLKSPGEHYFICTFQGHCQIGQKLAVNVTLTTTIATIPSSNSASIAVSPSLQATAPSEQSHTPSSASSHTIGSFSIVSLSIFASFFF